MLTTVEKVKEYLDVFGTEYVKSMGPFYEECSFHVSNLHSYFRRSDWQALENQCTSSLRTIYSLKGVAKDYDFQEIVGWLQSLEDLFIDFVDRKKAFTESSTQHLIAFVQGLDLLLTSILGGNNFALIERQTAVVAYSLRAFVRFYSQTSFKATGSPQSLTPLFSEAIATQLAQAFLKLPQSEFQTDLLSVAKDEIESVLVEIDRNQRIAAHNLREKLLTTFNEITTSAGVAATISFEGFEGDVDGRVFQSLYVNITRIIECRWNALQFLKKPGETAHFTIQLSEQCGSSIVQIVEPNWQIDFQAVLNNTTDLAGSKIDHLCSWEDKTNLYVTTTASNGSINLAYLRDTIVERGGSFQLLPLTDTSTGLKIRFSFPIDFYWEDVVIVRVGTKQLAVPLSQWRGTSRPGELRSVEYGSVIVDRGVYPVINLGKMDRKLDTAGGRHFLLLHLGEIPAALAVDEILARDRLFFISSKMRPALICGRANCSKYGAVQAINTLLVENDFETFSWRTPAHYDDSAFAAKAQHPAINLMSQHDFLLPIIHDAKATLEPRGFPLEQVFTKIAEQIEQIKGRLGIKGNSEIELPALNPEDDYIRRLILQQINKKGLSAA